MADRIGSTMAGKHPIHIHPVRPLYRIAATGLGASMWLFVSVFGSFWQLVADQRSQLMIRAKKDGSKRTAPHIERHLTSCRACIIRMEAPLGSLKKHDCRYGHVWPWG
jgi:hypothetical protein